MAKEKKQDSGWQFPKALEIVKCKEVEGLKGNGLLILMTETFLREEDMQKMQQSIERRIGDGTRVLVLDARIKKVMRLEV